MTLAEMLFNRLKQEGYFLERDRKYIQSLIEEHYKDAINDPWILTYDD